MGKAESKAAALLGRKGGAAGKGSVKVRGDAAHYRRIVGMRKDRVICQMILVPSVCPLCHAERPGGALVKKGDHACYPSCADPKRALTMDEAFGPKRT